VHARRYGNRGPAGGELFEHLEIDLIGLAAAADLFGVGETEQAGRAEGLEHLGRVAFVCLVLRRARREFVQREVPRQGDQVSGFRGRQHAVYGHAPECNRRL